MSIYADAVLALSPTAYFRLGETSGTSAADAVGGAAGTYTGGFTLGAAGLLPADPNTAASFNGSTGLVTAAHRTAFNLGNGPFTILCWVRPTTLPGSPNSPSFVDLGAGMPIMRGADTSGPFILRKNGTSTLCTSTTNLIVGIANFIAATWDSTTAHLYHQGNDVSGATSAATFVNNSAPLNMGAADGGVDNFFNGSESDVALIPSVLTATQIKTLWQIGCRARLLGSAGAGV